jgi:hypothetical protein
MVAGVGIALAVVRIFGLDGSAAIGATGVTMWSPPQSLSSSIGGRAYRASLEDGNVEHLRCRAAPLIVDGIFVALEVALRSVSFGVA